MGFQSFLYEDLIELDVKASDQRALFAYMAEKLWQKGYVKESYLSALQAREDAFPTAIPFAPDPIALPHAEKEHILRPFIAAVRLRDAVFWKEMGNDSETHLVRLAFFLGLTEAGEHIDLLERLVESFQNQNLVHRLLSAENKEAFASALKKMV